MSNAADAAPVELLQVGLMGLAPPSDDTNQWSMAAPLSPNVHPEPVHSPHSPATSVVNDHVLSSPKSMGQDTAASLRLTSDQETVASFRSLTSFAVQQLSQFGRRFLTPEVGEQRVAQCFSEWHVKTGDATGSSVAEQLLQLKSPCIDWEAAATFLLAALCDVALLQQAGLTASSISSKYHRPSSPRVVTLPPRSSVTSIPRHPRTSAVSLADSGIIRRASTAFYGQAVVGAEDHDGTFTINQHVVLIQLGRGSQGDVYLGMDTNCNELRAIKAIRRPASIGGGSSPCESPRTALEAARHLKRQMLEREIAIMRRCRHRNIVTLYEVIDDPTIDVMYLVMQYVEKGPVARVKADGTVTATVAPDVLVDYAIQICKGLRYLHRIGIIHRDVKPDNVLVGANGDVYLADFGVSELFETARGASSVMGTRGTIAFMAPELFNRKSPDERRDSVFSDSAPTTTTDSATNHNNNGAHGPVDPVDAAVDVFALGVTLHALLWGRLPWNSTNLVNLVHEISNLQNASEDLGGSVTTNTKVDSQSPHYDRHDTMAHASTHLDVAPLEGMQTSQHDVDSQPYTAIELALLPDGQLTTSVEVTEPYPDMQASIKSVSELWPHLIQCMLDPDPTRRLTIAAVLQRLEEFKAIFSSSQPASPLLMGLQASIRHSQIIVPRHLPPAKAATNNSGKVGDAANSSFNDDAHPP